jgi:hypothetical protein
VHDPQPRWSPARLAYGFYAIAATGAVIGQTWVALTHVPWSPAVPAWARVAAVLPFALCLELLAMALAAMADERLRLGERAYGFRVFSALVATVAVGILVLGHWPHYYWSAAFGILSSSAYLLWLLHSAARRRDALRAAGKLADTAPDYGLWRRLRYPIWTARAAELAREGRSDPSTGQWRPLGLYESLRAAQLAIRAEKRRPALAKAVEQVVRGDHHDPRMADIAVRTLDLDRVATELETLVDYPAWADRLAPAITVPASTHGNSLPTRPTPTTGTRRTVRDAASGRRPSHWTRVVIRREPGSADGLTLMPITQAAAPVPAAAAGSARTEQPHDAAPVAALPAQSPSGDHHDLASNAPALGERAGNVSDRTLSTDPGDAGPPIADVQPAALSETAAAVAYWRDRHPDMRPAEIAARVGKSERQVRRILATLDDTEPPRRDGALVSNLADAHR